MYAGHKSEDGRIEPLLEHLENVAQLCGEFAKEFGAEELGYQIGLCHDIGKYSQAFQKRLLYDGPKVDHSTAGGLELLSLLHGPVGTYCAFGHHGGLPDGGSKADSKGTGTMWGRLNRKAPADIPNYEAFRSEVKLKRPKEPDFHPMGKIGFSYSMFIRMMFSALVDADFLKTEAFMMERQVDRGGYENIEVLHQKLMDYAQPLCSGTSPINKKRSEILKSCIAKAHGAKGLYSLTVPTGGGKTISSLAFALCHGKRHKMRRVIYVIPYTSIIEQNAAVFSSILGWENVLEHHSAFDYGEESQEEREDDELRRRLYLSTENWDAPIVVTTNVQFFESLFAAKTSKCRKLHNIANSVIIFDEAQMLPLPYLHACVRSIGELVHNYGSTAVLCSATQPALDSFFPKEIARTEICDDPEGLYQFFRRTTVKDIGPLTDDDLVERLQDNEQALCIVSTRKQAQRIYELLDREGSYHLSTLMYPEHRKRVLNEIRERLKDGKSCRVVATSLIEAGVDVDFPVVYRAKAGLDSVIQAAGRCNREGKHSPEDSFVYMFEPDPSYKLAGSQRQLIEVMDMISAKHSDDLASLEAIHSYFASLYSVRAEGLDANQIVSQLEDGFAKSASFPFKRIAEQFRLIEQDTYTVLIPNCAQSMECARRLRQGERSRALMRQVGRYSVNVYKNHYDQLRALGIIDLVDSWTDSHLAVLMEQSSYDENMGLPLSPECGKGLFVEG